MDGYEQVTNEASAKGESRLEKRERERIRHTKAMIDGKVMLNDREGERETLALAINQIGAAAALPRCTTKHTCSVVLSDINTMMRCFYFYLANGH